MEVKVIHDLELDLLLAEKALSQLSLPYEITLCNNPRILTQYDNYNSLWGIEDTAFVALQRRQLVKGLVASAFERAIIEQRAFATERDKNKRNVL